MISIDVRVLTEAQEVGDVESAVRLRSAPITNDAAVFEELAETSDAVHRGSTGYVLKNILPACKLCLENHPRTGQFGPLSSICIPKIGRN